MRAFELSAAPVQRTEEQSASARIARVLLAVFAFGIPLDVVVATRLGSTSAALGIPLVSAAAVHVLLSRRLRPLPPALVGLVAYTAWSAVTVLWASDVKAFTTRITTTVQLLGFVLLSWQLLLSRRDLHAMLCGFLLGCVVTAAEAWRSFAFVGEIAEGLPRYAAQSFDPNDMAVTLGIGIPVAAFFAAGGRRRDRLALAYIPLAGSAIALSASRGGGLTFVMAIVCVLFWAGRSSRRLLGMTLLLLAAGAAMAAWLVPGDTWARIFTVREQLSGGSIGDRAQIWQAGLDVLARHPWFGVGAGGFPAAVAPALGAKVVAHNTLLSIAVDLGAVGLLLFVVSLGSAIRSAARRARRDRALTWSLLFTWLVGTSSLTWDYQKTTWLVVLVGVAVGALRQPVGEPETS